MLKRILTNYISARKDRKHFVSDILLHSSIVGLGAKFKLLRHIAAKEKWPKIDSNHFHTVVKIRNAFAHCDTVMRHTIIARRKDGSNEVQDSFYLLETLETSGEYKQVKRKVALSKFTQSYVAVRDYLHEIDSDQVEKAS